MARCISQIRVRHGEAFHDVPCGRCNFCLQNRRKEWSFRLQKELRQHESAYFLTLTYHDIAVPMKRMVRIEATGEILSEDELDGLQVSDEPEMMVPVLRKEDFQKFMKRLRKRHGRYTDSKIKYYAVGEYGSNTGRPHYHAIIFGLEPKVLSHIGTIWVDGFVHVGSVNADSIDYVTKYVINKYDFSDYPVPPFSLISNGIGLDHLVQNKKRYKNETTVCGDRGYPQVLPRYYKDKLQRNLFTNEIIKKKSNLDHEAAEQAEIERLSKLHPDPLSYIREREVANHNRISKSSKKGDKI